MDSLNDGADAAGGASGSPEQPPSFQLGEGAFAGGSQPGVVTVELLVVLGLFAVAVVRGSKGGAGTLVGAVREDEDLPGQAGLDDAMGRPGPRSGRGCDRGVARENHSGVPSGRAMTCTFMPCLRCFIE